MLINNLVWNISMHCILFVMLSWVMRKNLHHYYSIHYPNTDHHFLSSYGVGLVKIPKTLLTENVFSYPELVDWNREITVCKTQYGIRAGLMQQIVSCLSSENRYFFYYMACMYQEYLEKIISRQNSNTASAGERMMEKQAKMLVLQISLICMVSIVVLWLPSVF